MNTNAQYEAMRLDIACLKRDNDELRRKLAAAEALVICRWTQEHQRTLDRILQSHINDVEQLLAAAEAREERFAA